MTDPEPERESESDRRRFNIFMLVFFLAITGAGIWLAKAMVDARKADDCIAQGRRNCAPIEVAPRQ